MTKKVTHLDLHTFQTHKPRDMESLAQNPNTYECKRKQS
jgi:hypothetical protein